jgi:cell division septum initiation protein DivIVA
MPPAIDASIKRKVIQQWLSGDPRDKIAIDNNIGEGTVSSVVSDFKIGLDNSEFDSARELALQAKKQGLNLSGLASNFRLSNFIKGAGATEDQIESFIINVSSSDIPPEKVVGYVNQLYDISKEQSIPLDQVATYIEQKLEEKQKIDEEIKETDAVLQSKNVSIEATDEHVKLNEELNKHGFSTKELEKLLNLLVNAKRYGFDGKEIASKLYSIQELEWKEKQLKKKCKKLSKRISKYKDVVPLTEEIAALQIGIDELIALKVGIREAAKWYNLPFFSATLRLIEDIKKYNKIDGLKREISALYLQKYMLDEACSRQSQSLVNLAKLKSYGITKDKTITSMKNFLENNIYKDTKPNSSVEEL